METSTIYALASARGKAGIAVVRISGPKANQAIELLATQVPPRRASLRRLKFEGSHLDDAVVISFPGPGSFTGEDVVELHLHGSQAVTAAVLRALESLDGFRIAEPGEFTRRALENEKLDLSQIEGLADLIEAETEAQRRQALRVLSGAIGERTLEWRAMLIRAAALMEATIDFADEDVPTDVLPEVQSLLGAVMSQFKSELAGASSAERVREGFEVAIVGPPNVGKSTLLNRLAGREAAITSEIAGTTRDVVEVRMDIGGLPVTLLDTAGIRETSDIIERKGVSLAVERARQADLRVILKSDDGAAIMDPVQDDIVLVSKADLGAGDISALSGEGVDELIDRIGKTLSLRVASAGLIVRERHRRALLAATDALDSAMNRVRTTPELAELISEDIRTAVRSVDSLVGHVGVEDILDEIFSSFCIGK
ncbi:MAG: tRNA uridine-5-carboxymethylaminomethyl(34) synthesis GTPase MnmE [Silicimonas sp.]|nr:tRNA uridine-5-carboxymethylaminomethyl(34) synthesis GTPase MnmE [Silicimonas sp.]